MARSTRIPRSPEQAPPGGGSPPPARPRTESSAEAQELFELLALAGLLHSHRRRGARTPSPLRRAA